MLPVSRKCLFNTVLLILSSLPLAAQQASRIADLNAGAVGSFPSNLTVFGNALYFTAYTFDTGRELFKYDGTAITLVTNINNTQDLDGSGNDSSPYGLTVLNGGLYFTAYDQRRGGELWCYNGTNALRVADINADINDVIKILPNSSWPQELTVFNNALYFSANSGGNGPVSENYELWRYDGTRASMVTNIHADAGTNFSSYPNHLATFQDALYFMADDGVHGYELWKHDATRTVLLSDINPGINSAYPKYFTPYKNNLYFQAYDDVHGYELWRTDGTNTQLVIDLNPTGSSYPELFTIFNNKLYFRATDGANGFQLWQYDGASFDRITHLDPSGALSLKRPTIFQNALYFAGEDGVHGWELWKYDGTSATLVADLNPTGDSFPEDLTVWNNKLFFTATNAAMGYELWSYDGQTATPYDLFPGPASSFPFNLTGFGSALYFSANDSYFSDWELWGLKLFPLQITGINFLGSDVRVTWKTSGGTTNILQAADQMGGGFQNVSGPIYIPGSGEATTNYLHVGAFQGGSNHFYRVIRP